MRRPGTGPSRRRETMYNGCFLEWMLFWSQKYIVLFILLVIWPEDEVHLSMVQNTDEKHKYNNEHKNAYLMIGLLLGSDYLNFAY